MSEEKSAMAKKTIDKTQLDELTAEDAAKLRAFRRDAVAANNRAKQAAIALEGALDELAAEYDCVPGSFVGAARIDRSK